jgi:flavin reductase (DIM6/NTAB) family NADH-FMN oxidoreductase RutF
MNLDLEQSTVGRTYRLLMGLIVPRPIALVTSMNENGHLNAAPFSAYGCLCIDPPIIGLGISKRPGQSYAPKDTTRNIQRTGEFVVNVVTEDIADKMNLCAIDFPPEMSEVEVAGFTTAPSQVVKTPRLAEAHAALECREHSTIEIGHSRIILGRVVALYVEDRYIDAAQTNVNAEALHVIGRMDKEGNYARTRDAFLTIPRVSYKEWEAKKP